VSDDEQTQQADDPSGPGWRDVEVGEVLQHTDMFRDSAGAWVFTENNGVAVREGWERTYRRRIEQQQPSDSEPETMEDLRKRLAVAVRQNVELADELEDVRRSKAAHQRIAKASVSRAQEAEVLLAEADRGGEQVNAELQQLREQVQTLTRELRAERDSGMIALRSQNRLGQEALAEALQTWLRPVLELVAEHPDECSPLAVSVLGYLPGIASRLIEE